ncbi:MAG: type I DNA topoisomerase [Candidatus Latescibacterota bacterium]
MATKMIIVESKAKTQSIGKIVGKDYKVHHCLGHIYDLPPKELGIDVDKGYKPNFRIVPGKNKLVRELKEAAKSVDEVILATDPDREGESIAWHLSRIFPKTKKITRMTFNEITAKAILEALNNLKEIDKRLVDAQQARRVLDRLVGYKISPLLWKNLNNSRLSAGRVQSVALRLICEREREVDSFVPTEYWTITAEFIQRIAGARAFVSEFVGTVDASMEIPNEQEAGNLVSILRDLQYRIASVTKRNERRKPQPPFITSTLQQDASRKLHYSASKTMALAQQLYEGIELGAEGTIGLITYMRTDSVRVSGDSQQQAREFIKKKFGDDYLPPSPPLYKSKKSAQDAHEAIRCTDCFREPDSIAGFLSKDQLKLYSIIWSRFIASQMQSASLDVTRVDIIGDDKYLFRTSGSKLRFDGFLRLNNKQSDDQDKDKFIPDVADGEPLELNELSPLQHFTKPPARFSEASLVKELEERGIGRPSTYVPTIETLKKREYVTLVKRNFVSTKWGFIVNDLLAKNFTDIVDYEFTARMENDLDRIESGDIQWDKIVDSFYKPFSKNLDNASKNMRFEEKTDEKCEKCESDLVVKTGKFGLFLGCGKYPECNFTKPYGQEKKAAAESAKPEPTGEKCDKCGMEMVIRRGRFGPFIACSGYPRCKNKKPYVGDVNCPNDGCGGKVVIRRTKKGRTFYGCSRYPDCNFVSWQAPIEGESCPKCNSFLVRAKAEGENVKKCAKESCGNIIKLEETDE